MRAREFISESVNLKPRKISTLDLSKLGDAIGFGVQAKTFINPKTQNSVIKVAQLTTPDDTTVHFVDFIARHQDNPFFPKIYSAKLYDISNTEMAKDDRVYWLFLHEERLHDTEEESGGGDITEGFFHYLVSLGFLFDSDYAKYIQDYIEKEDDNWRIAIW